MKNETRIKTIHVRMRNDMYKKLKDLAERDEELPMSALIRKVLWRYIDLVEEKDGENKEMSEMQREIKEM